MITLNFTLHKFVVIGAGATGQAVLNYLRWRQALVLRILDTRVNPPQLSEPVSGGPLAFAQLRDADVIVISPGVSIYEPALQSALSQGKAVIGDIELFAQAIRCWPTKVIGISGSNGKTTVTSLTGFLATSGGIKTVVAGNIGTQVLEVLMELETSGAYPELIVLELSSFQLETTQSLNLVSATVLNISEDHLDRYRDLLEYAYVKANIFNNCQIQVLNVDDPMVMAMARPGLGHSYFGSGAATYALCERGVERWLTVAGEDYLEVGALQLVGQHNYSNCLASLALLAGAGYHPAQFKDSLSQFGGLEHRMQKVCENAGVLYLEDSKGTNVGAVIAGVSGIERPVHLILGGDGKGQDFTPLRHLVSTKCKSVALIGQDAAALAAVLDGLPNICRYSSLEAAVSGCVAQAVAGDAVILSPACASWDMFSNYKQRAQVFIDSIYAIIQKDL